MKRLLAWFYHRWFWVDDQTKGLSLWFNNNCNIVPVDYKGGCSSTAFPKNWKEVYKILDAMEEYGSKKIRITVFIVIFGKRRYNVDYYWSAPDKEIT